MKRLVDPQNITKFNRTQEELEAFLLFVPTIAGKNSDTQAAKLHRFLFESDFIYMGSPFALVSLMVASGTLRKNMERVGLGQYGRLIRSFGDIIKLDVNSCTVEDLENCHGIGLKSSRFFLTHSRENAEYAILDTHILKFLRDEGHYTPEKTTPTNPKRYKTLENFYLDIARLSGMSVADHDLMVWKFYRTK